MKALVLSGGGARGAFQAGVLSRMVKEGMGGFDVITGTSVGAINAAFLAQFPKDQFSLAVEQLERLWLGGLQVWKPRFLPFRILATLFGAKSIGSNRNLKRLLRENIDLADLRDTDVELRIPAVNLITGVLAVATHKTPDVLNWVLASSAVPAMFPPVKIQTTSGKQYHADGSLRETAPIRSAIKAGASDITAILTAHPQHVEGVKKVGSAWKIALRSLDILTHETLRNDIEICRKQFSGVSSRGMKRIIAYHPSVELPSLLSFSKKDIKQSFNQGFSLDPTITT